jgi:hypothetical protein
VEEVVAVKMAKEMGEKKVKQMPETEGCRGVQCCYNGARTPGGQIPHGEARGVKLNRTRVVSCETANGENVVNHTRSHKNIRDMKGAVRTSSAHGGDRNASAISDHDGRGTRRVGRTKRRK